MKTIAIILAAGSGKRMQADKNKQFLLLNGRPVLAHTLSVFEASAVIDGVILVVKDGEQDYCQREILDKGQYQKIIAVAVGGKERQDSVWQGLLALPESCQWVVVHDGARPLVTPAEIANTLAAVSKSCGAVLGAPVKDTIKRVDEDNKVVETPARQNLWQVYTPQIFAKEQIVAAYSTAMREGYYGTDDASLVEHFGGGVVMVGGSYENIKITTPVDLILAEAILNARCQREEEKCSE